MSQNIDPSDQQAPLAPESGFEALRRSPGFQGSVEPVDTHDHSALIYETEAELFSAAVPFIRQGLARGEQCIYVLDERAEAEIVENHGGDTWVESDPGEGSTFYVTLPGADVG